MLHFSLRPQSEAFLWETRGPRPPAPPQRLSADPEDTRLLTASLVFGLPFSKAGERQKRLNWNASAVRGKNTAFAFFKIVLCDVENSSVDPEFFQNSSRK